MTVAAEAPKTAAIRLPNLGKLWAGRKAKLRPEPPSTRIMRQPNEISTRMMAANEVPTRRMMRTPQEEETRVMDNPELFGDDFIQPPTQEELDFFIHGIPGMRRKISALRLPNIDVGGLKSVGQRGLRGLGRYLKDPVGTKLKSRGQKLLDRGSTAPAATKAIDAGRTRAMGTAAAVPAAIVGGAAMGGSSEPVAPSPDQQAQTRLQQRMSSPVGGLLDDIINPETKEMAQARETERANLGDNISLLQRWQLMDPSIRTLLVSLLLGGGLAAGSSMLR